MLTIKGEDKGELLEIVTQEMLTKEDMQTFKEALNGKLLQEEPVNLLFIFKNIEGNTASALLEAFKLIPYVKRIKKSAIVADDTMTEWDETIEKFIPGVEIVTYAHDDEASAREWLSE